MRTPVPRAEFTLAEDGLLVRRNILDPAFFARFGKAVEDSWLDGHGWRTRILGHTGRPGTTERLTGHTRSLVAAQIDGHRAAQPDAFTYMYDALHQSRDESGLIEHIGAALIEAWSDQIAQLVEAPWRTNFSLTAYPPGSHLGAHTDDDGYRLTLLLYFASEPAGLAPLEFDYRGQRATIPAVANTSVLFVPSAETVHWLAPVPSTGSASVRLAFSGWLV